MNTIELIRDILKRKDIDKFEILEKKINKISIEVNKSIVEDLKFSEDYQISVRILKNHKMGFFYISTPYTTENEIENIINNTIASLMVVDKDKNYIINETKESFNKSYINKDIERLSSEEMVEYSKLIEECAYKYDKRIKIVKNAGLKKGILYVKYINSFGAEKFYKSNFLSASVVTVAQENDESYMGYENFISKELDIDFKRLAESAAKKAVRMFGAKKGFSMKKPVIFENELVCDILSLIASSFFLENIDKRKSLFFQNKKGDKVASNNINIIDDGITENLNASVPFDDEGTDTTKKYLLKEGIISGFLNNQYYAFKYNERPTGNGFKPLFKTQPAISITNLILEKGNDSLVNGFKEVKEGIYLTNLMGLHTANPISGDFSLGAEGIIIENGELSYPIKEIVISGNLRDVLLNIKNIYNNVKTSGVIYAPSILVEGLTISG